MRVRCCADVHDAAAPAYANELQRMAASRCFIFQRPPNGQWTYSGNIGGPANTGEARMLPLVVLIVTLALFDVVAYLWGADSSDGPDSPEWDRRRHWRGFGG